MNALSQQHLTEDELDEILIADGLAAQALSEDRAAHYFACAHCRARRQDFTAALDTFNQASMAWSEARSNTLNRDLSQAAARQRRALSFSDFGALTAALLMVVAFVATHTARRVDSAPVLSAAPVSYAAPPAIAVAQATPAGTIRQGGPAEIDLRAGAESAAGNTPQRGAPARNQAGSEAIDRDNEMLLAIDSALSTPEPSPAELYRANDATPLNPSQFDDDRVND